MRTIAVVQARMGSTRLPGKVMADVGGQPMIDGLLARLSRAKTLDGVIVATSVEPADDRLADHLASRGIAVFRGSESDVLARFFGAAQAAGAEVAVRITADCPFIDPTLVDDVVSLRATEGADWAGNVLERKWPDGLDVEAMTIAALARAHVEASHPYCRSHVTPFLHGQVPAGVKAGHFKRVHLSGDADFSHLRWTVDEPEDLEFARRVVSALPEPFHWLDLVALLTREPALQRINGHVGFNEGSKRDLSQTEGRSFDRSNQMFGRALDAIPLASQTFSKSWMTWTKGAAPLFIERARGSHIIDIDGNAYVDYVLGLLPIVLGYCDPDVDEAIIDQLGKGTTFSLPAMLETEVAERIIRLVPSAEKVRFCKNGSDATSAAVRLARAFTGRDDVLVAGYHGWQDWYIGSTTRDLGVPAAVRALTGRFSFNDANSLESALIERGDRVAAIVLEPSGVVGPAPGFLERVRELATKHGAVLVFDEIITGFRMGLGGAQAHFGVTPDLTALGKAIANGMPLAAITGRADIMALMDDIFFSGTMGGETLSLAAAAATIDKLERENGCARIWAHGDALMASINRLADRHGLSGNVAIVGDGWWPLVKLTPPNGVSGELMTSLFRQEVVAHGVLLAATLNLCLAHINPRVEAETLHGLDLAFSTLRGHLNASDPKSRLRGRLIEPTFKVR